MAMRTARKYNRNIFIEEKYDVLSSHLRECPLFSKQKMWLILKVACLDCRLLIDDQRKSERIVSPGVRKRFGTGIGDATLARCSHSADSSY